MTHLKLTINMGNSTFQDGNKRRETVRILKKLTEDIGTYKNPEILLDINGNRVGSVEYGAEEQAWKNY